MKMFRVQFKALFSAVLTIGMGGT